MKTIWMVRYFDPRQFEIRIVDVLFETIEEAEIYIKKREKEHPELVFSNPQKMLIKK